MGDKCYGNRMPNLRPIKLRPHTSFEASKASGTESM